MLRMQTMRLFGEIGGAYSIVSAVLCDYLSKTPPLSLHGMHYVGLKQLVLGAHVYRMITLPIIRCSRVSCAHIVMTFRDGNRTEPETN